MVSSKEYRMDGIGLRVTWEHPHTKKSIFLSMLVWLFEDDTTSQASDTIYTRIKKRMSYF